MASYLVTGTSRGLGLAMVAHLANSSESDVGVIFAAARSQTPDLQSLVKKSSGRVVYIDMDTTNQVNVDNAVNAVEKRLGDQGLDYLINNAGVGGFAPGWTENLTDLNEEFNVNVSGTHIVTTLFLPLLRKGQAKKIMNIGSTMGSLALAEMFSIFPLPAYKVSKAALNALTIQWAQALSGEGFVVTSINPGTVKSAMGGGKVADLTLEQGATGILEAIVKGGPEKNGKFSMITVPGWENAAGLHRYDGSFMQW
ncbi:short-chain dehydrogenase-like protein [Aspergillus cavernicola]|uniref:Short-chain dehydrogenase-like protein n=1 Tax=Aspergillus cavernicola TaxID=176166 RepID=A0ABR4IP37_9EURO